MQGLMRIIAQRKERRGGGGGEERERERERERKMKNCAIDSRITCTGQKTRDVVYLIFLQVIES